MNQLATFHGRTAITITTGGIADIRAIVRHFTEPFQAAQPFQDVIETIKRNSTPRRRSRNEGRSAAIEIRKAVTDQMLEAITVARDRISVALTPPDEEDIRAVIAAMLETFPNAQPTATSPRYIDVLVFELRNPEDWPYSLPAISAACRQCWQTLEAPPSIATFLTAVRKHQDRIEGVMKQLGDILEAVDWAADQIGLE